MNEFLSNVKILINILSKKENNLASILNISSNQEGILRAEIKNESEDLLAFNTKMNEEKQVLIDDILKLDKLFEKTFIKISADFEKNAKLNKLQIKSMQNKITQIENLDKSIRRQELINKNIILSSTKYTKKEVTKNQIQYILKQYKLNCKDN